MLFSWKADAPGYRGMKRASRVWWQSSAEDGVQDTGDDEADDADGR